MLARKGIFARPSIPQLCAAREGDSRKGLRSKAFCGYYTTKQKCLLARAFLRGRQYHSRAQHGEATAVKACAARLSVDIIQWSFGLVFSLPFFSPLKLLFFPR